MSKIGAPITPGRVRMWTQHILAAWPAAGLLRLLIAGLLILAAARLAGAASYIGYLASTATVFDVWGVLSLFEALLSLTAIAGAGFAVMRRRLFLALAFAVLALPMAVVIEGRRCDTDASCRLMGWAALPASAGEWSVRIRPVTDPTEAERIASTALSKAGSNDQTYKTKRFADHWIVSTIDKDGWPGAHAVKIDTRTAATSLVACPARQIQCGMERPVVSDGRRIFRNDQLGLAAVFPAGRPVCTSRSNGEARGFYGIVRSTDLPCDNIDHSHMMGVVAAPNQIKARTVAAALNAPCRPLSPEVARLFDDPRPTLSGHAAVTCESSSGDWIQISVYALVAAPSMPGDPPRMLYEGYIVTTQAHLAEDARSFQAFLKSVSIGFQQSS